MKPILLFTYDLEIYNEERGMYYNFKEIAPGPLLFSGKELIDAIKNIDKIDIDYKELRKLENVVNYHFRGKPDVSKVSMEVVSEIAKDFILPIDFDSEEHDPTIEEGCGEKCKYLIAKKEGRI